MTSENVILIGRQYCVCENRNDGCCHGCTVTRITVSQKVYAKINSWALMSEVVFGNTCNDSVRYSTGSILIWSRHKNTVLDHVQAEYRTESLQVLPKATSDISAQ